MRIAIVLPLLFAVLAAGALAVLAVVLWAAMPGLEGPAGNRLLLHAVPAAGALLLAFAVAWAFLHLRLVRPLASLARDVETRTHNAASRTLALPEGHMLGEAAGAVEALLSRFDEARRQTREAVDAATARAERQKRRLEAILLDLSEGVIVCDLDHRILLYNQAAARILNRTAALGLGRQLFGLVTRDPILHTLEQLQASARVERAAERDGAIRRFVCSVVETGALLQARLGLVADPAGAPTGYVLTFTDVSADLANLARRDALLREVTRSWRATLASLAAAAEMLASRDAAMTAQERAAFERVVCEEAADLSAKLARLTHEYGTLAAGQWPMTDIHSIDLFRAVAAHPHARGGIAVTLVGLPLWLHADSHSLMLTLEHVLRSVHEETGLTEFDIEALLGDRHVYVQIAWDGATMPAQVVESWLDEPLAGTIGSRTAREVIETHGSEIWSQELSSGRACIRMPLAAPTRPQFLEREERLPPRPEFYDFDLFQPPDEAIEDVALARLHCVVFDTETTGLRPTAGDQLISIGAVRVVNGRILTGETFERVVNPGRPIPKGSTRFHRITDDMVRDKPPAHVVMPQFKAFVGGSVLVAYNAAFDMKFLQMKEAESGVRFDNPVLDVLLLSAFLHDHADDHSLEAAAGRLGVEVAGRHNAIGDAFATAAMFVRMIEPLRARGVETLGQAVAVSGRMAGLRWRQARF